MKVYIIHKTIWRQHHFQQNQGSVKWKVTTVGEVKSDRRAAHEALLAEGFEVVGGGWFEAGWFDGEYCRRAQIDPDPGKSFVFEWDEADIIEREVQGT